MSPVLATANATVLHVNDTPASLYLGTFSLRQAGYRMLEAVTGGKHCGSPSIRAPTSSCST